MEELVIQEEVPYFKNQEERDVFIKEYSQQCWWLATYLDSSIPQLTT